MLGDAVVYGFSLYVVSRGSVWQARVALLKGAVNVRLRRHPRSETRIAALVSGRP